ncbi:MAG: nucleoside 2-deoxyribosyltransferase [Peptoniphilaceae bacterium]|nr:nucleoside 2-deoxyribosyltransferase [Peptoniphilaceae bacterium]MDY5766399.1 nucleoside 2-deoxyribosyltransferase [Peptoniphilaceae bacterium]
MKVYFAAPLFSEGEQRFNAYLAEAIRKAYPGLDMYVPQEQDEINDKTKYADSKMIAQVDTDRVMASDLMIAVLDGLSLDSGVAAEIGIAYAKGIPVLGLFTDVRQQGADVPEKIEALREVAESQFPYINLYVIGLIKKNGEVVRSTQELVDIMRHYVE